MAEDTLKYQAAIQASLTRVYEVLSEMPKLAEVANKEMASLATRMEKCLADIKSKEAMAKSEKQKSDADMYQMVLPDVTPLTIAEEENDPSVGKRQGAMRRVSVTLSPSLSGEFKSRKSGEIVRKSLDKGKDEEVEEPERRGRGWETMTRLQSGFLAFREKVETNCLSVFQSLKFHQEPKVMIIACVDSRVSPNMVLQAHPGDIFTHRNVANLVPPYEKLGDYHGTSAAIEYAVCHLKIEHLVVMGHSNCGGIRSLMDDSQNDAIEAGEYGHDFIPSWMRLAHPARTQAKRYCKDKDFQQQCSYCEKEAINGSLANLLTFPFVKDAVNNGNLSLHGWYYDMTHLKLSTWNMRLLISDMKTL